MFDEYKRERLEEEYEKGREAAESGDPCDGLMHTLGPLFSFGLETDEAKAWDKGFADENDEIRLC